MTTADTAAAADPLAALKAQLAAQAQDNPGLAMLMQLMEAGSMASVDNRQAAQDDVTDVIDIRAQPAADTLSLDAPLRADLQALLLGSEQLAAELAVLQERNDALAAALGACHLCFGADNWCPHCGGCGTPGSRRPDAAAFSRYVRPLLDRLQRPQRPQRATATEHRGAPCRTSPAPPDSTEGLRAGAA